MKSNERGKKTGAAAGTGGEPRLVGGGADRRGQIERIREAALEPVLASLGGAPATGRKWHCWNKEAHKHADRKAAAIVRGAWFRCYGCGVQGDAFALLMQARTMTFPEAGRTAARLAGLEWPELGGDEERISDEAAVERAAAGALRRLADWWATGNKRYEAAAAYWAGADAERLRRVVDDMDIGWARAHRPGGPAEMVERLGAEIPEALRRRALQAAGILKRPEAWDEKRPIAAAFYAMCMGGGVTMPVTEGGRVVDIVCRRFLTAAEAAEGRPKVLKLTAGLHPWGLDDVRGRAIVLVEGEGDRVAVAAAADDVAPVSVGTQLVGGTTGHGGEDGDRWLRRLRGYQERGGRVYIGLDDDEAGDRAAGAFAIALPGAYIVRWGGNDAREALAAGRLNVGAAIAGAETAATLRPHRAVAWPDAPGRYKLVDGALLLETWNQNKGEYVPLPVAPRPIWPAGITRDAETGAMDMTVAWQGTGVRYAVIPRADALSGNILRLADLGAPISDANKKMVSKWLLEAETAWRLPELERVRRLGWHGGTCVLGDRSIGERRLLPSTADLELARIMAAVRREGSRDEWLSVVRDAWDASDVAVFALSAAAASPLLPRLGVRDSFILHLWAHAKSSVGKTTLALLALSLWMRPSRGRESWNLTATKLETMAHALSAFPYLLDEVGQRRSDKQLGDLLYVIGNRRGAGKKPVSNPRFRAAEWHNIVFSTGERMLTAVGAFEGQRVRALEVAEAPFAPGSQDLVRRIADVAERSYGWASEWLEAALAPEGLLSTWHDAAKAAVGDQGGVGGRLTDLGAAITAAGAHFANHFGLDAAKPARVVPAMIAKQVAERADEGDYVTRALQELLSNVSETRLYYTDAAPAGHRYGAILHEKPAEDAEFVERNDSIAPKQAPGMLAVFPSRLHRALTELGYADVNGLVRSWAAAGIIRRDGVHLQGKVRVKGGRFRAYIFPFEAIAEHVKFNPPDDLEGQFEEDYD